MEINLKQVMENNEEKNNKTRLEKFSGKTGEEIFNLIYETRDWTSEESISGNGSTLEHTKKSRIILPRIFKKYEIKRVLDSACGDFNWIKRIAANLEYYRGEDIVRELIAVNKRRYEVKRKIEFRYGDIIEKIDNYNYDAIILKDVLVHLPNSDVNKVLQNLKKSGIKYAFITHFTKLEKNIDLEIHGQWRPMNFKLFPWGLGKPLEIIEEKSEFYSWTSEKKEKSEERNDKTLTMWKI